MFAKLLTALVFTVVIGACIFNLRQQRLELMHEVTGLHRQMNRDRQATWDKQVRIAELTQPETLRQALQRAGMEMEPAVTHTNTLDDTDPPVINARHE
jgi:cell division protein FtsL